MKKVLFFDWDGTLQSTKVSEHANVKRTQMFAKELSKEEIIKIQHNSNNDHYKFVQNLMKKVLPLENIDELRTFQAILFGYYYITFMKENKDDILLFNKEELLKIKQKYNLKLVIVTTLYSGNINAALKIHNLENVFDEVYPCPADLSTTKLDNLQKAIENNKNNIPFAMFGDRGEDVEAGKKFNLKTVYCNYGHGIDHMDADIIIEKETDLIKAIEEIVSNP